MRQWLCWAMLICLTASGALAQNRDALEREKRENQRKINEAARILKETRTERRATLGQLNALRARYEAQKDLLASLADEIELLTDEIASLNDITEALQRDLKALRAEYAAVVYTASKVSRRDRLVFLFSAQTFNQFTRRLRYLRQYAEVRSEQVAEIEKLRDLLVGQQQTLRQKQAEQEELLAEKTAETEKLASLASDRDRVLRQLTSQETRVRRDLAQRKRNDARLQKLIADLIEREARRAAAAAAASKAETSVVSSSFAANRRKLPWPVNSGFVSKAFGRHPHPVLKNITVDNAGVDIQTSQGAEVKAVFAGEVGFVASIPGMNGRIVSVQHGDYFTVYAGLKDVRVKAKQQVAHQEILGTVYTDKEGVSEFQFQVWHENKRLNPQQWLRKR